MYRRIVLFFMGGMTILAVSAQVPSVDYGQLATKCQLVVELNGQKDQKQSELDALTAELEALQQQWLDICYAAIEDPNTTQEDFQYLIDNTFPEIDDKNLVEDLNKAIQGEEVTRRTGAPKATPNKPKKNEPSVPETQEEKSTKEQPKQSEVPEPDNSKVNPTKKANDSDKNVIPEKKEDDKTTLKPDELEKQRKKKNYNQ